MQTKIVVILIGLGLTTSLNARTALNCTKVLEMRPDLVMACYDQTNDWLNDTYQVLLNTPKDCIAQINSLTGYPVSDAVSTVTVAAPNCTEAGILSTLAILQGKQAGEFLKTQSRPFWIQLAT